MTLLMSKFTSTVIPIYIYVMPYFQILGFYSSVGDNL